MRYGNIATAASLAAIATLGACSGKHDTVTTNTTTVMTSASAAPAEASAKMPKPGLWQMTVTSEGMPQPMKISTCMAASVPGTNPFSPPAQPGQQCTRNAFSKTATGYSVDMTCKINGMTVATTGAVSGDLVSSFKTVMQTKISGPNIPAAMQAPRTTTLDAAYVGPCPAGMKPGTAKQG